MITIPASTQVTSDGSLIAPAQPIPENATAVVCDGQNYTIYQPGDELPDSGA